MRGREINYACTYADQWGQNAGCVENIKYVHRATDSYGYKYTYGARTDGGMPQREEGWSNESNATTAEESKRCHLKESTVINRGTTHDFTLVTQLPGAVAAYNTETWYEEGYRASSIGIDRISDGITYLWDTAFEKGKIGYMLSEGYQFSYYNFWDRRYGYPRGNIFYESSADRYATNNTSTSLWSAWDPRSVKEYYTTLTRTTASIIEEDAAVKPFVIKYDNVNNIFHVTTINYDKGYKFVEDNTKFITSAEVSRHTDFSGVPHNLLNVYNTEEAKGLFGTYETITKDQYLFNPAYLFSEGTNNNNYIVYKTVTLTNASDLQLKEAGKPRALNTKHPIDNTRRSTLSFRKRSQVEPISDFLRHDNYKNTFNNDYVHISTIRVLDEETYNTTSSEYKTRRYVNRTTYNLLSESTRFKPNFLQEKHFETSANYGVSEIYFNSPMKELFTEYDYIYGTYGNLNITSVTQYEDETFAEDDVWVGPAFGGERVNGMTFHNINGESSEFKGKSRGTYTTHTKRYSQTNFEIARIKSIQQYYRDAEINQYSTKDGKSTRIWRDRIKKGKEYFTYHGYNEPDWSITNVSTFIPRLIYSYTTKEIVEHRNTRTETETFNLQIDFGTESTVPGKTYYLNKNRKYWSISNGQAIVQTPYDEWEDSASVGEIFILENKHISYKNSNRGIVYGRISNGFMTTHETYKEVVRQIVYLSQRTSTFGEEPFIETSTEYGSWLRIMNYNLKSSEMTSNANVTSAFNAKYSERKDAHLWMKMGRYENTAFTIRNTYEVAQDNYLSITTRNTSSTMTYHNDKYLSGMSANGYNSIYCIGGTDYEGNNISYFINGNIRTEIFSADPNKDMVYETSGELIRNYYSYAWKVSEIETRHNALKLEGSDKTIIRNASPTGVITVTATEMEYDYLFHYNYMSYFNSAYDTIHDVVHSNDQRFQNNCLINDPEKYNALVPKEIIP